MIVAIERLGESRGVDKEAWRVRVIEEVVENNEYEAVRAVNEVGWNVFVTGGNEGDKRVASTRGQTLVRRLSSADEICHICRCLRQHK